MAFVLVDFSGSTYFELRELLRTIAMTSGGVAGAMTILYLLLGKLTGFWRGIAQKGEMYEAPLNAEARRSADSERVRGVDAISEP